MRKKKKGDVDAGTDEVEINPDDIATIIRKPPTPSDTAKAALQRHVSHIDTAGAYVAATLDGQFRGPGFFLEGNFEATVAVYSRETGMRVGEAQIRVPITFSMEHCRDQ